MSTSSRNLLVLFALLCGAVAAGCGGGGTSPISYPTQSPRPPIVFPTPPTAAPTNNSYRPSPSPNETNLYQFTGFIIQEFVRPPVTVSPIPSPNPTVSATIGSTVNINYNVTSGNSFNNVSNLTDFSGVETDTGVFGQLNLLSIKSDTYYQYTPNSNSTSVSVVGMQTEREVGTPNQVTFKTVYGPGNGLVDVIPEPSQTGQSVPVGPANNAALTTTETDPDGQVTTRTVNPDGSYTEHATYPDGTASTAVVNADATGQYSLPLLGIQPNSSVAVGAESGGMIPITVTYAPGVAGPGQVIVNLSVPNWYPSLPVTLSKETYLNNGPKVLPNPYPTPSPLPTTGACNLGNDINGIPLTHIQQKPFSNQLVQAITKVDPVFGEIETTTTTTYVTQGVGATCWEILDVVNQYYDYSGQTVFIPFFSSTPVQVTTTDETIGIGFATINNQSIYFGPGRHTSGKQPPGQAHQSFGKSQSRQSQQSMMTQSRLVASSVTQSFMHRLERERLKRHAMFWRQLKSIHQHPRGIR